MLIQFKSDIEFDFYRNLEADVELFRLFSKRLMSKEITHFIKLEKIYADTLTLRNIVV